MLSGGTARTWDIDGDNSLVDKKEDKIKMRKVKKQKRNSTRLVQFCFCFCLETSNVLWLCMGFMCTLPVQVVGTITGNDGNWDIMYLIVQELHMKNKQI